MNQSECVASTIQNMLCQSIRMHCVNQSEFVMSNYFGLIMLQFFNQLTFHGLLFLKLSQTFMSSHRIFNVTLSGLHMFFKNVFFPVDVCSETHNIRGLQSREWTLLCCVCSSLLHLRLLARHIQHQHVSIVIQTIVWYDQSITTSVRLVYAAKRAPTVVACQDTFAVPDTYAHNNKNNNVIG